MAVAGGIDAIWCNRQTAMKVSDPRRCARHIAVKQKAEIGSERREHGFLHRYIDSRADSGPLSAHQCRHDPCIKVRAGKEVAQRHAGLHWRLVGKAGRAHDSGHRLHRDIHGLVSAIGAVLTVTTA